MIQQTIKLLNYGRKSVSQKEPCNRHLQDEQQENRYEIFHVTPSETRFIEGHPTMQSAADRVSELAEQSYGCIYEVRRKDGLMVLTFHCISDG